MNAFITYNLEFQGPNRFMLFPATDKNGRINFSSVLIDEMGDTIRSKKYTNSNYTYFTGWANSTNNTPDGGFIMGGGIAIRSQDRGLLIKFDSLGDTSWTKQFGDTTNFRTFRQARPTTDGGYIAVGEFEALGQRSDGWLVKTDSSGNIQWEKYYSVSLGTHESLSSVFQCTDGGYILGGVEWEFPNQIIRNYDPIIIKVDSLGNQQWRYKHDTPANDGNAYVIQTQDGNFVFATPISMPEPAPYHQIAHAQAALVKVNNTGALIWEKIWSCGQ